MGVVTLLGLHQLFSWGLSSSQVLLEPLSPLLLLELEQEQLLLVEVVGFLLFLDDQGLGCTKLSAAERLLLLAGATVSSHHYSFTGLFIGRM